MATIEERAAHSTNIRHIPERFLSCYDLILEVTLLLLGCQTFLNLSAYIQNLQCDCDVID